MRLGICCSLALLSVLALSGCGADDPTGPTPPPPPGQPGSQYDGLWTADFTPYDYPVRGLRFEIQGGALVHVYLDSFWDLLQCDRAFTNTRFDPPAPVPVQNGTVTVSGLVSGPLTIDAMAVTFTSATTSTGGITVSLDQGSPCVAGGVQDVFQAEK